MTQEYPEDCLQSLISPWWVRAEAKEVRRGRLLWAVVPHVDQELYRLVSEGRTEPTEHGSANYRLELFEGKDYSPPPTLPVAAQPEYPGEVRLVYRSKRRPALVLSTGGADIPKNLKIGAARHQTHPTLLAAPYYGADLGGKTGGWRPDLVEHIRRCRYPQYMWDSLPVGGRKESILRLDHLQPIGKHGKTYELTSFELHPEALAIVDEYLFWALTGEFPSDSLLKDIRTELLGLG